MTADPVPGGPVDIDAERAVISAVVLDPTVYPDVTLTGDEFADTRNGRLWARIIECHDAGQPLDPLTLTAGLEPGLRTYLADIAGTAPSPSSARHYAHIVAKQATLRRLVRAGTRIVQTASNNGHDAAETAETCRALVDEAIGLGPEHQVPPLAETLPGTLDALHRPLTTVGTPWKALDVLTGGLHDGGLYVVGGRPGLGKSIFGQQLGMHVARDTGRAVLLSSLEMSAAEVHCRLLAEATSTRLGRLVTHDLDDTDWTRIAAALPALDLPVYIDDRAAVRVVDIRARARDVARRHRLGLVVVDYLQLITPPARQPNREREVAEISRSLKLLGREMSCPVLALSQLNRSSQTRVDKHPVSADLRESGAIEADADGVLLLYLDDDADDVDSELELIIAKNRFGPTGVVRLLWQPEYARISPVYSPKGTR